MRVSTAFTVWFLTCLIEARGIALHQEPFVAPHDDDAKVKNIWDMGKEMFAVLDREPFFGASLDAEPKVKDKIWDMGAEMCKNRPEHPICSKFKWGHKDPTTTIEVTTTPATAATTPATTTTATARTQATTVATTTATTTATTIASTITTTTTASTTTVVTTTTTAACSAITEDSGCKARKDCSWEGGSCAKMGAESVKKESSSLSKDENPELPEHGYWGPMVRHEDQETAAGDWQKEYPEHKHDGSHHSQEKSAHSAAQAPLALARGGLLGEVLFSTIVASLALRL
jgi:hypothetical protein